MTLRKAAAPCPCNNGAVDAGQPPFWRVGGTQPTPGYSDCEEAVIVGGATRARLVGGLIGPVWSPRGLSLFIPLDSVQ